MKKSIKSCSAAALATAASTVFAHPGHDHTHWLSGPIHLLCTLAIGLIVMTAFIVRNKKKLSEKI